MTRIQILRRARLFIGCSVFILLLGACGTLEGPTSGLPRLDPAHGAVIASCAAAADVVRDGETTIATAAMVAAGMLKAPGIDSPMPEHCLIVGKMRTRISPVDGRTYAIGFEMRLPVRWNGRFFYQANGGIDGAVVTAYGIDSGGAPTSNALARGFAVMSSDAGHPGAYGATFGWDPQARLDYGYQAVGSLTPLAKRIIVAAYGKGPERSYLGGCSNGGRHAMVAAARYADQYDGIFAGDPGFHLPKAAVSQLYGVQQYASIASPDADGRPNIATAFRPEEFALVARRILARCDALDGAVDGIVSDAKACQAHFDLGADVPTCAGTRDGTCLTAAQKGVLGNIFAGPKNGKGDSLYARFWFDPGLTGEDFRHWKFGNSLDLDPGAVAAIFTTPPSRHPPRPRFVKGAGPYEGLDYALAFSMDTDAPRIFATDAVYAESPWSFMTPPDETRLDTLRGRGAKLLVYHGAADPVFSPADTAAWYEALARAHGGDARDFARLFVVPGMNHCRGGPATDQFDMLGALVDWVENGHAPERVIATARGTGANVVNSEVPATWSPGRTRPLCAYPASAQYKGQGDIEDARSFECK